MSGFPVHFFCTEIEIPMNDRTLHAHGPLASICEQFQYYGLKCPALHPSDAGRLSYSPPMSEGNTSTVVKGFFRRMARIVSANTSDPPSFKSSRATAVTTTCFKFISATESATRSGSANQVRSASPVFTAQKRQARVQTAPRIINVLYGVRPNIRGCSDNGLLHKRYVSFFLASISLNQYSFHSYST